MNTGQRFWAKVKKTSGCWLWVGAKQRRGYGYLHNGGHSKRKPIRAHRYSWEIHNGPIPAGLWVLHKCDAPSCVNPAHLFLGTRSDNMKDAASKGRICTVGKSRLTQCKHGHKFTAENTYRDPRGHRRCITCRRAAAIREGTASSKQGGRE